MADIAHGTDPQHVEILELTQVGDTTVYCRIPAEVAGKLGMKKSTWVRFVFRADDVIEIRKEKA